MNKSRQVGKYVASLIVIIFTAGIIQGGCAYMGKEKPIHAVFVSKNADPNFVFWETMHMGAELAAKELGVELTYIGPEDENSAAEQSAIVDDVIEQKPDILIISPIDKEILKEPLERADQAGLIIVGVDSTTEQIRYNVATDNVGAAKTLMHAMSEMLQEGGMVGVLNFEAESTSTIGREMGCKEAAKVYDNIHVLPTVYTDGTTEDAYIAAKKLLAQYPQLKGIFGVNQYMTEGAYLAVKELGLIGQVKVVGFDSSEMIIEGIEKEGIQAILVQKPFNMGYMSVRMGIELLKGQNISEQYDSDYKLITKEELYETENQKLIYPIVK